MKFLEHDANGNGSLSLDEFQSCLESTALGLSEKVSFRFSAAFFSDRFSIPSILFLPNQSFI